MDTKLNQLMSLAHNHYRDGQFLETVNFSLVDLHKQGIDALGEAKTQEEIKSHLNSLINNINQEKQKEGCNLYLAMRNLGNLKFLKQQVTLVAALRGMDLI